MAQFTINVKNILRSPFSTVETHRLLVYPGIQKLTKNEYFIMKFFRSYIRQEFRHTQNCLLEGHGPSVNSAANPNKRTNLCSLWHILWSFLVLSFEVSLGLYKSPNALGATWFMTRSFTSPFLSVWHVPGRGLCAEESEMNGPCKTWVLASVQFKWETSMQPDRKWLLWLHLPREWQSCFDRSTARGGVVQSAL